MRRTSIVFLPLAAVLALVLLRANGPQPKPASAAQSQFSAIRAMESLRHVLADRVPHPIGTDENRRVRARIESQFRALGLEVTIQRRFACNAAATCAPVENIVATRPDRGLDEAVLLVAHYDSVGAGMGASDDGIGVATLLEIARATRGEVSRNPLAFLITDGEEAGLLGAEAFAAEPDLSGKIGAVINIEMRGTHGASNLFETSPDNRWLIRHLAGAIERPQASSLFYTIYDLMPNDTDVTVFKRAGIASVNFAAIRGVNRYHTPNDDLSHASLRTLQHHGDNILASARALANADLAARSNSDATWFDLLGFKLLWWPEEWTVWIGVASLILLLFGIRKLPPRRMTFGVLATFTSVILAVAGGLALARLAALQTEGTNFVARPLPLIAAMCLWGLAAAYIANALFHSRKDARPMIYGAAIVWHMIAIALALTLPGAAFLFLVPAVAATVCALSDAPEAIVASVAATTTAVLFFPIIVVLYDALGSAMIFVNALMIALLATFFAPLFARRWTAITLAVLAIAAAVTAMLQPAWTAFRPRHVQIAWVDDAQRESPVWSANAVTPAMARAVPFRKDGPSITPWTRGSGWVAPAPRLGTGRVTIDGARAGNRVTVRVRTERPANRLTLLVRGGAVERVNGVKPPPRPERFRTRLASGWSGAAVHGLREMVVDVTAAGPIEVVASDLSFGLPPEGRSLAQARDGSNAVTYQDGDVTITRARSRF
jgi:hypothetical protein